jgi:energy-coupling factor transport system ATP-binding protein
VSIILDKINYIYSQDTAYQIQALKDINLVIGDGEFIGIIGHTGSGKSTLIQHLNGLIKATSGNIYFNGRDIYEDDFDMRELKRRYLTMYHLDRRIRGYPRKKPDCAPLKR